MFMPSAEKLELDAIAAVMERHTTGETRRDDP
jgi:hypothetical protein